MNKIKTFDDKKRFEQWIRIYFENIYGENESFLKTSFLWRIIMGNDYMNI